MWQDYKEKSVLDLVYGRISAIVEKLDATHYGVRLSPYDAFTVEGTLEQAKHQATTKLILWLSEAVGNLPVADMHRAVMNIQQIYQLKKN